MSKEIDYLAEAFYSNLTKVGDTMELRVNLTLSEDALIRIADNIHKAIIYNQLHDLTEVNPVKTIMYELAAQLRLHDTTTVDHASYTKNTA